MVLIKSISGIRGTIGGRAGDGLNPLDIVMYTAGFGMWVKENFVLQDKNLKNKKAKIVVGRDARISGLMVNHIVIGTLIGLGIDVVNIGLATTPTVEIAVPEEKADGGIILTASHNPEQWNALKLLNQLGEFITDKEGKEVFAIAENEQFDFAGVDELGSLTEDFSYEKKHIEKVTNLSLVDIPAIKSANIKVVIDGVNSVGGMVIPKLLRRLGVNQVVELYCEPTGHFPHDPEPLPGNLKEVSKTVIKNRADVGFVVDPDVDRLAIINEDGSMFGEEYTLVAVADYVLRNTKGNTVSNLSSTRALREVTEKYGGTYYASAVGEVNVVFAMKKNDAIIGGEGNGGIIYPEIHYGRDALVGIALFLSHLAKSKKKCSELRTMYPDYYISKNKIQLTHDINSDKILTAMKNKYESYPINEVDGIKIEFEKEWIHLRKSNTEHIIRIYAESYSPEKANVLAGKIIKEIKEIN